jgi:endonuclease/exonuclease/phosphatase (EEP) superfamily protein YafD
MKTYKGSEPIITYPTGLRSGYRMDEDAGCLDYIWFKNLNLEYAEVVTHNGGPQLFPSDHYPLYAVFNIS